MHDTIRNTTAAILAAGAMVFAQHGIAAEPATAAEAQAMVKKGIAFLKANGKEKGIAEFSNKSGQFVDRDLYLTATKPDGVVVAHGVNDKMIGRNLIELKDVDGKEFIRELVDPAKPKTGFWVDYKFTNPVSKKVEPKSMYCERFEDLSVCGGVYKKS
jgi:hypothetical protein